jgi:predicted ATP-dependent serine protease
MRAGKGNAPPNGTRPWKKCREKHNPAGSSLQKESSPFAKPNSQRISEIDATESPRMDTTNAEFNRVLGGGLVPGSVTLLGGEPGMVSLRCCCNRVPPFKTPICFYEKSAQQIKMRAERIKKMSIIATS